MTEKLKHTDSLQAKKTAQRFHNPVVPKLMPLKDAAQYMGMTVWALRERVWAGHIPFVQFPDGRKWYFDVADLDAAIMSFKKKY